MSLLYGAFTITKRTKEMKKFNLLIIQFIKKIHLKRGDYEKRCSVALGMNQPKKVKIKSLALNRQKRL